MPLADDDDDDDDQPVSPQRERSTSDIPDAVVDVEEEEEESEGDSDETIDYRDLFVGERVQLNRNSVAILDPSQSHNMLMVRLLTSSLSCPTLTSYHRLHTLQRRNVSSFVRVTPTSRKSTPALRMKTRPF